MTPTCNGSNASSSNPDGASTPSGTTPIRGRTTKAGGKPPARRSKATTTRPGRPPPTTSSRSEANGRRISAKACRTSTASRFRTPTGRSGSSPAAPTTPTIRACDTKTSSPPPTAKSVTRPACASTTCGPNTPTSTNGRHTCGTSSPQAAASACSTRSEPTRRNRDGPACRWDRRASSASCSHPAASST